jgi:hypothetical protein
MIAHAMLVTIMGPDTHPEVATAIDRAASALAGIAKRRPNTVADSAIAFMRAQLPTPVVENRLLSLVRSRVRKDVGADELASVSHVSGKRKRADEEPTNDPDDAPTVDDPPLPLAKRNRVSADLVASDDAAAAAADPAPDVESGAVAMESGLPQSDQEIYRAFGLDDLPYGIYFVLAAEDAHRGAHAGKKPRAGREAINFQSVDAFQQTGAWLRGTVARASSFEKYSLAIVRGTEFSFAAGEESGWRDGGDGNALMCRVATLHCPLIEQTRACFDAALDFFV